MDKFTIEEAVLLYRALECFAQDHKEAREAAEQRAADPTYEFRKEALDASNFHAEQRNLITLLKTKVRRLYP